MKLEQFDFDLPPERIAQHALPRGESRLLVVPKNETGVNHYKFSEIVDLFKSGDCLVLNDTKVIPARLFAQKMDTQARIEILLHRESSPGCWEALARPVRRLRKGAELRIGTEPLYVDEILSDGKIKLHFQSAAAGNDLIEKHGITPLPPYIRRSRETYAETEKEDSQRYQTVFARHAGAVAAPTAGLHFTPELLTAMESKGINVLTVTLHVGWGTFAPVTEAQVKRQRLHIERYILSEETAAGINACKHAGKRVIACGTTTARTLETSADHKGIVHAGSGETDLFIQPGYTWRIIDGLLTNFHLPKSSLFMLVCALGGVERMRDAYREAIAREYRFYSYGDAMLYL